MKKDFEIDLSNGHKNENRIVELPTNFLSFGEIEPDDVKVYIKQNIYNALEKYASADTEHERGTIIIGNHCEELGNTHVIISDFIEAKYTDASASTLTFTHKTWDYVHKQRDRLYPDKKIVGWQHTHPGYGIFLSNYDLFIQENFFNLPFQVAYVIDPIQEIRGFFQWKNGKIEKLKGFYIYDDIGKPIKIEQPKKKKKDETATARKRGLPVALFALLFLCTFTLATMFANLKNQMHEQEGRQMKLEHEVAEQTANIESLKSEFERKLEGLGNGKTLQDLLEQIDTQQDRINDQEKIIDQLQKLVVGETGGNPTTGNRFVSYVVKEGDTLFEICKKNNINYAIDIDLIEKMNNIEDIDLIYIGQTILLPER